MTSNAYIATDGETVMKVGKANDVKRRERQIAIPIKYTKPFQRNKPASTR
jgi:hypothetical protein